jgi:hypothetical protein
MECPTHTRNTRSAATPLISAFLDGKIGEHSVFGALEITFMDVWRFDDFIVQNVTLDNLRLRSAVSPTAKETNFLKHGCLWD